MVFPLRMLFLYDATPNYLIEFSMLSHVNKLKNHTYVVKLMLSNIMYIILKPRKTS